MDARSCAGGAMRPSRAARKPNAAGVSPSVAGAMSCSAPRVRPPCGRCASSGARPKGRARLAARLSIRGSWRRSSSTIAARLVRFWPGKVAGREGMEGIGAARDRGDIVPNRIEQNTNNARACGCVFLTTAVPCGPAARAPFPLLPHAFYAPACEINASVIGSRAVLPLKSHSALVDVRGPTIEETERGLPCSGHLPSRPS
jgi:hypothetical protein